MEKYDHTENDSLEFKYVIGYLILFLNIVEKIMLR